MWSPYRLNPNVENVDKFGRTVVFPDGLPVGEALVCALEKTFPPGWVSGDAARWWSDEYGNKPIRLLIECERAGLPPWRVKVEVDAPVDPLDTIM